MGQLEKKCALLLKQAFFFVFKEYLTKLHRQTGTLKRLANRNFKTFYIRPTTWLNIPFTNLDCLPMRLRTSSEERNEQILRINPSRKITSDKQIVMPLKLHGKLFKSLKSWSCIAAAKSIVIYFRLVHLLASSCRILDVINSMGSSMYSSVGLKRWPSRQVKYSKFLTWMASLNSGLSLIVFHSFGFWARLRQLRQTSAQVFFSWWLRNEKMQSMSFSGRELMSFCCYW